MILFKVTGIDHILPKMDKEFIDELEQMADDNVIPVAVVPRHDEFPVRHGICKRTHGDVLFNLSEQDFSDINVAELPIHRGTPTLGRRCMYCGVPDYVVNDGCKCHYIQYWKGEHFVEVHKNEILHFAYAKTSKIPVSETEVATVYTPLEGVGSPLCIISKLEDKPVEEMFLKTQEAVDEFIENFYLCVKEEGDDIAYLAVAKTEEKIPEGWQDLDEWEVSEMLNDCTVIYYTPEGFMSDGLI